MNDGRKDSATSQADEEEVLISECRIITHYLVDREPREDLIARYVEANHILLSGETDPTDRSLVAFVRRHPQSLPYLDAVLALLRRNSVLRSKILLMLAILETEPEFVKFFFPEPISKIGFWRRVIGYGLSNGTKFLIGSLVYPFAVRAKV